MTNRSNDSRLEELQKTYGVKPCRDKEEFFSNTDIIVLAFKPKDAAESIENIREYVKDQLVISVIAGLTIHTIQQYFGRKLTIIRAMPNTSAAIQQSATGFSASSEASEAEIRTAKSFWKQSEKRRALKKNTLTPSQPLPEAVPPMCTGMSKQWKRPPFKPACRKKRQKS